MPKAVQLDRYGSVDVLAIVERPQPAPQAGEVVVRVVAAGTNPGEISIREGYLKDMFPKAFPFGQGTDFAGRVETVGAGVTGVAAGDEVIGRSEERTAQAEFVAIAAEMLVRKPPALDWYRAGSLGVAGLTALAAVRAVAPHSGETVAVSGAAGGVGSLAIQLARLEGARVIGIASAANADFLASVGVEHVAYGDGLADRLRAAAPGGIDAFIDLFGDGYVETALELGIAPQRINTIIDFAAAQKHGVKTDGAAEATSNANLSALAELVAWGKIVMPLAAIYPFERLRDAYTELARRKANGKIVLSIDGSVRAVLHPQKSSPSSP